MAGANILVVEDDAELLQLIGRALEAAGHRVQLAPSGEAGLRQFQADPPDLVVCDIVMPDRDGIELIPQMKALKDEVKILAISGRQMIGLLDVLNLALQLGADSTLPKPFELDNLVAHAEALLPAR
ncbi:response regulator transcription factor [Phenylobacterium soli]|uniref:response regulator transcription factor n=1 Tax=Phenylobacterium soli TaxID=2170551 RepID=UPI001403E9A2|nr:response regulator [Phenylobacterium soli]